MSAPIGDLGFEEDYYNSKATAVESKIDTTVQSPGAPGPQLRSSSLLVVLLPSAPMVLSPPHMPGR